MPDALTIDQKTADGFLVVSRKLRLYSVKPPYEYRYEAEWFPTLTGPDSADECYQELASGEREGWSPVGIFPCFRGVPMGAAPMGGM